MPVDIFQLQWHKLGKCSVVAPTPNTDLDGRGLFTYDFLHLFAVPSVKPVTNV